MPRDNEERISSREVARGEGRGTDTAPKKEYYDDEKGGSRRAPSEREAGSATRDAQDDDTGGEVTAGGGREKTLFPEDVYDAEVKDIVFKSMPNKYKGGQETPKIIFEFSVINDADYEGKTISRFLDRSLGEKSMPVEWYKKILRTEIKKGDKINFMDLVGKKCRISIVNKVPKGGGEKFSRVDNVLQVKSRAE